MAWEEVEEDREEAKAALEEIESFRQEVASDMESYSSEKSEKWQEGDAGQAFTEWSDKWDSGWEDIGLDAFENAPEEIETPDEPEAVQEKLPEESWSDSVAEALPIDLDGNQAEPEKRNAPGGKA